jgi:hypothetical protein
MTSCLPKAEILVDQFPLRLTSGHWRPLPKHPSLRHQSANSDLKISKLNL